MKDNRPTFEKYTKQELIDLLNEIRDELGHCENAELIDLFNEIRDELSHCEDVSDLEKKLGVDLST